MKIAERKKTERKSDYKNYAPFNNPSNKPRVKGLNIIQSIAGENDKFKKFLNKKIDMNLVNDFLAHLEEDGKYNLAKFFEQFGDKFYINKDYPQHRKDDILITKYVRKYHNIENNKEREISKAKVKESEHIIRQKIIDKILPMISKIFLDKSTDTFNPSDINVSLSHISSRGKSKVLGNCYTKSCDRQNKKMTQIHINIDTLYHDEEKKKLKWSVKNFYDFLEVLVHELVHATDNCKSSHGKEFKRIAKAVGLDGVGGKSGKDFTSTKPNDDFDIMFKDVIKEGKKWLFTEWNWESKKRICKTKTYKCETCGSRFSVTNQNAKHTNVKWKCNHEGTDYENSKPSEMVETTKPQKPLEPNPFNNL
jgi:hypothetical protein